MTPQHVVDELLAQHASLRVMMDDCDRLADELEAGSGSPLALTRRVAQLRLAFQAHNRYEESVLRPLLCDTGAFGDVRIDRMIEDHAGEHRAMHARLATGPTAELRATVTSLRDHLTGEERYFVSAKILRDDLVVIESGG